MIDPQEISGRLHLKARRFNPFNGVIPPSIPMRDSMSDKMTVQDYIRQQPLVIAEAIATAAKSFESWRARTPGFLVGSGSSFNALTAAAATTSASIHQSLRVSGPANFLKELEQGAALDRDGFVVILSQSGASATSVAAAQMAATRGCNVLVITCEPASPIAQLPLARIVLPIGGEPIGPKTKGFTATLAGALALLAHADSRPLPGFNSAAFETLIAKSDAMAERLARALDDLDYLVVAGSGRFFGIALEASLKVAEIAGVATAAFDMEELLHGRLHAVGPRSLVLLIIGSDMEREIAEVAARAMARRGVRALLLNLSGRSTPDDWIKLEPDEHRILDVLSAIVPFQWLAVHLAIRRGRQPETMRYPGLSADLAIKVKAS
jgi:fructoselysine-6-P-deglycase FrlB-like protein